MRRDLVALATWLGLLIALVVVVLAISGSVAKADEKLVIKIDCGDEVCVINKKQLGLLINGALQMKEELDALRAKDCFSIPDKRNS